MGRVCVCMRATAPRYKCDTVQDSLHTRGGLLQLRALLIRCGSSRAWMYELIRLQAGTLQRVHG